MTEGRDEAATPGAVSEPDLTDVVTHSWLGSPAKVTITPTTDSASVGTCNPFTIKVSDSADQGLAQLTVDVEQVHALSQNSTAGDEPAVAFCTPSAGPNPSAVDSTKGDLVESPDNLGTAGGETVTKTDGDGKVTIGITVQPTSSSDGTGVVHLTAWYETSDNDDPNSGEPSATATKTWIAPQGRTQSVTCLVQDRFGEPIGGESVTFSEAGPGEIVGPTIATSSAQGLVSVTVTSLQPGLESVTATITDDLTGAEPADVDECDRAAGDPSGAPAGRCADSVTVSWTQATPTRSVLSPAESRSLPGEDQTLVLTITDAQGQPVAGVAYSASVAGVGTIASADPFTDANGTARIVLHSGEPGDESLTVLVGTCAMPDACNAIAVHHWGPSRCDIFGTNGPDVLNGTGLSETICGFGGNDRISGRRGSDIIYAGDGNDYVIGGGGPDSLHGQSGRDTLRGGPGNDLLFGGEDSDVLLGGGGADVLHGGSGADTLIGGTGNDACLGGPDPDDVRRCES
ncbi:MAG: Ig-like domain-containing protein [Actinomycetota bacterium]|nr:Ig-like domain-containing protein [Actinomycetota bacterium]